MAKSLKMRRNKQSIGGYLAAGVGSMSMVSATDAGVVAIDIAGKGLGGINAGVSSGSFKFVNGIGLGDIMVFNNYQGYFGMQAVARFEFAVQNSRPTQFLNNQSVGADSTFSNGPASNFYRRNVNVMSPDFGPNMFMGFRSGTSPLYYYGYLEVTWVGATKSFEILSGAYESTPNTAIFTPSGNGGGAVPEPASGAIAALLMGGAALRKWRKKSHKDESANFDSLAS